MDRFPQMLYRQPAAGPDPVILQDGAYSALVVNDDVQFDAALADGWHESSPAARAAYEDQIAAALEKAAQDKVAADNVAPTRAELEAKATELQIAFTAKTSDKKLSDQIAAALEP